MDEISAELLDMLITLLNEHKLLFINNSGCLEELRIDF
jgi:hypothetical protein